MADQSPHASERVVTASELSLLADCPFLPNAPDSLSDPFNETSVGLRVGADIDYNAQIAALTGGTFGIVPTVFAPPIPRLMRCV